MSGAVTAGRLLFLLRLPSKSLGESSRLPGMLRLLAGTDRTVGDVTRVLPLVEGED